VEIIVTFNTVTTFAAVPIGGKFIEAMTTCNEVAIRIEPTTHQDKSVNARRVGGKLIFMADWEPVFVQGRVHSCSIMGRMFVLRGR
jgi:hypothetical protein